MRSNRLVEVLVGLFMLAGLAALLMLALKVSGLSFTSYQNTYEVKASFDNIGGLKIRSPVSLAGVEIGEVKAITIDKATFKAVVTLVINSKINYLPVDTSANILTEGLLGENYIGLVPGYSENTLKDGSTIESTHSALVLENLIGQLLYKFKS